MYIRLLLVFLALAGIVFFLRWFMGTPTETISRVIKRAAVIIAAGMLIFLAASGRLHWLFALLGSLLPFTRKLVGLIRYLPLLQRLHSHFQSAQSQGASQKNNTSGSNRQKPPGSGKMPRDEALDILGLKAGADKQAIIQAHRRLIQKVHPDRGGTDYLASQLNMAKKVLIGKTGNA